MTNQTAVQALTQKAGYYKAVGKELATNPKIVASAIAITAMTVAPEAMAAAGTTSEVNFKSLADEALDSIKNAGAAALGVFGVGITIVGSFKGYSLLKRGINRA